MWAKSKFALCQPRYYNLLTTKKYKKIDVFEVFISFFFFFFEDVSLLSIYSLQTPSLDDRFLGSLTLSNVIILVGELIRWKRGFEIFLIYHNAGDIKNKNIAGKY